MIWRAIGALVIGLALLAFMIGLWIWHWPR
jgi:hypothetical protein